MRLTGHKKEGYGLSWNQTQEGLLVSGSDDSLIATWDVNAAALKKGGKMAPLSVYEGHKSVVEDVAWHYHHAHLFASVGDDRQLMVWDTREKNTKQPLHASRAHKAEINSVAFNPMSEFVLATGSADRTVGLWDMRNMGTKMHSFENHTDEIVLVAWNPHNEALLASAGSDRRINIWNLGKIGEEQDPEDAEDGPPELLFIHGGHTSKVSDFSWNPNEPYVVASVAEDNILQVWSAAEHLFEDDEAPNDVEMKENGEKENGDAKQPVPNDMLE